MRDPSGELAEGRHLLRLNQAGLRSLQVAKCLLGGVACCADLSFGALALGYVAVDQHGAAARYRIDPHLNHPPVRPDALGCPLRADAFGQTPNLSIDIDSAVFAVFHKIADI